VDTLAALLDGTRQLDLHTAGYPGQLRLWPGWDSGWCALDEDLCYLQVDGAWPAAWNDDGGEMRPGCFLWLPTGSRLRFRAGDGDPGSVLRFRFRLDGKGRRPADARPRFLSQAWSLRPAIAELLREVEAPRRAHSDALQRALLLRVLAGALRLEADSGREPRLSATQIETLRRYVHQHIAEHPRPAELADLLGLSHDYCTRLFRRSFGMAPRRWLLHERMRLAAARLGNGEESVQEVAEAFGYQNPKLFGRQFRQIMGEAPGRWRRGQGAAAP